MSQQLGPFVQFEGLIPALDVRQVQTPHVTNGQNFIVDAEGPASSFSSDFATYARLGDPLNQQSFQIENRIFQMQNDGVYEYDIPSHVFYPLYIGSAATAVFPWSRAIVGGKYYFAKKGSDVLQYDPANDAWKIVDNTNILGTVYAVTQAAGRLLILTEQWLQWSAIDDGEDLATDADKGVGAQQISAHIGSGKPLGVFATADGAISYSETGWMKTERVQALNPFRHYAIAGIDHAPITSYCIVTIGENEHIVLTKSGFRQTTGGHPVEWQAPWNEYLRQEVLLDFDLSDERLFKLYADWDKQIFSLSIGDTGQAGVYAHADILYLPTNKWGSFDKIHHGFGMLNLTIPPSSGFNFGFICAISGCINKFTTQPHTEHPVDYNITYFFQPAYDFPARSLGGVTIFPTYMRYRTELDETKLMGGAGIYDRYTNAPQARDLRSINSFVTLGPFRLTAQTEQDRLTEITDVLIGTDEISDAGEEDDYMDEIKYPGDVEEDWLTFQPETEEDWGFDVVEGVDYEAFGIGTLDGINIWDDNYKQLTPLITEGGARTFTCNVQGLYTGIYVDATKEKQSFHVKTLDMRALLAGRIS